MKKREKRTSHRQVATSSPERLPTQWKRAIELLNTPNNISSSQLIELTEKLEQTSFALETSAKEQICGNVIATLIKLFQNNKDNLLASRICQLIATSIVKKNLSFSLSLPSHHENIILQFLLQLADESQTWLLIDCLRALSYFLFEASPQIKIENQKVIFDCLVPLCKLCYAELDVRRQAINCVGSAYYRTGVNGFNHYHQIIFHCLMENYDNTFKQIQEDISFGKFMTSIMRTMGYIISESKKCHIPHVHKLVLCLKKLILFGTKMLPSPSVPSSHSSKAHSDSIASLTATSDSDISDNDGQSDNREAIKIRVQALQLLGAMSKSDFKSMFAEWKELLPDDPQHLIPQPKFNPTISTVLLFDPCSKCRAASAKTIVNLFDNSRLFLAQADDSLTKSAFTPFSHTLAAILRETHNSLLISVENEKSSIVLLNVLKAISTVIDNSPYEKLSTLIPFLPKIIPLLLKIIKNSEITLKNGALGSLASLCGTKYPLKIVKDKLLNDPTTLQTCLSIYADQSNSVLGNDAAQVLSNIGKNYPEVFKKHWNIIFGHISSAVSCHEQTLRLSSIQIVYNLTCMEVTESGEVGMQKQTPSTSLIRNPTSIDTKVDVMTEKMWIDIYNNILCKCFNDVAHSIRSTSILTCANVSPTLYMCFPEKLSTSLLVHVFNGTKDEIATVRAAACRALGIMVTWECIYQNINLLSDVSSNIEPLLSDKITNVRIRACWVMANLCDSLKNAKWIENVDNAKYEEVLLRIFTLIFNSCDDDEKVRCNSVRALGNIAQFLSPAILGLDMSIKTTKPRYNFQKDSQNILPISIIRVEEAICKELISSLQAKSSVKLRWNACYALGNLFRNVHIQISMDNAIWELCELIKHDSNFKVRIQAAQALSALNRQFSREIEVEMWNSLIFAFCNIDLNSVDYKEYKHAKTLINQIKRTIIHLLTLLFSNSSKRPNMQAGENEKLKNIIIDNAQLLFTIMKDEIASSESNNCNIFDIAEQLSTFFVVNQNNKIAEDLSDLLKQQTFK